MGKRKIRRRRKCSTPTPGSSCGHPTARPEVTGCVGAPPYSEHLNPVIQKLFVSNKGSSLAMVVTLLISLLVCTYFFLPTPPTH